MKNRTDILIGKSQQPNKEINQENHTLDEEKLKHKHKYSQTLTSIFHSQGTKETFVKENIRKWEKRYSKRVLVYFGIRRIPLFIGENISQKGK